MRHRADRTLSPLSQKTVGRIGVVQWRLDCSGVEALYRAAELGFAAIHVDAGGRNGSPFLYDTATLRLYQTACADTGIAITGIAVNALNQYGLPGSFHTDNTDNSWKVIQCAIDAAAALNVGLVFLPSFHKSEIRGHDELQRTAEVLKHACLYGASSQVLIATENSLGARENLRLVQLVGHPNFRIIFDTQNPVLWEHNPRELVKELHRFFCNQVHIKDGNEGIMGNTLLTAGQADVATTLQALQDVGFSGDMILENDYRSDTEVRVKHDLAVLNSLLSTQSKQ